MTRAEGIPGKAHAVEGKILWYMGMFGLLLSSLGSCKLQWWM